jgi:hypothetical protein
VCRVLAQAPSSLPYDATAWDATRIQACVCDAGYFGTDCSARRCPSGDDPLTQCEETATERGQVQQITLTLGSALTHDLVDSGCATWTGSPIPSNMGLFGTDADTTTCTVQAQAARAQLLVGATDRYGTVHYAPTAVQVALSNWAAATSGAGASTNSTTLPMDDGAKSLKVALENIKNFKVNKVNVDAQFVHPAGTSNVLQKRYLVTFVPDRDSSSNVGVQNNLVCKSAYACATHGCAPVVKMPFLYRYAAVEGPTINQDLLKPATPFTLGYYTSNDNSAAFFSGKKFVRLDASSAPQLPPGVEPDNMLSGNALQRYDIRVVVATKSTGAPSTEANSFWTRVTYGHANISAQSSEYTDGKKGVWSDAQAPAGNIDNFSPTLLGMTFQGAIPLSKIVPVAGAPGVVLNFPDTKMNSDPNSYRFFEILIKLPACSVSPLIKGDEFKDVSGAVIKAVDARVENAECSNRGQCNRDTGLCECFSGFYGVACSHQTTMV